MVYYLDFHRELIHLSKEVLRHSVAILTKVDEDLTEEYEWQDKSKPVEEENSGVEISVAVTKNDDLSFGSARND